MKKRFYVLRDNRNKKSPIAEANLKAGRSMGLEPTTNGTTNHYSNQLS